MLATKRFTVHERVPQRVYTTDSVRQRDVVLTVPTEAELAAYFSGRTKVDLGKVWDGLIKPMLDNLDRKTRDEVLAKYAGTLASSELTPGPAESLTANNTRPEQEFLLDTSADPTDLNAAQNDFWDKRLGRSITKDHAGPGLSTRATPQSIQSANSKFWRDRNAPQSSVVGFNRWGKG
jgi:hypothetical protein